jgi:hypothetical protein
MMKHFVTITLLLALFTAGCGRDLPKGMPPLYPCTLTFTQEGAPLADASIALIPVDAVLPWTFAGQTNAAGQVTLYAHGQYPGVPAGKWKVTVTKLQTAEKNGLAWSVSLVELSYNTPAATPLDMEIVKGRNAYTFDCGKAVNIKVGNAFRIDGVPADESK